MMSNLPLFLKQSNHCIGMENGVDKNPEIPDKNEWPADKDISQ